MKTRTCPRCGGEKATTVMLPAAPGAGGTRPHPAFRCMTCDTQWSEDKPRMTATKDDSERPSPSST